jgi:hypothetical protein
MSLFPGRQQGYKFFKNIIGGSPAAAYVGTNQTWSGDEACNFLQAYSGQDLAQFPVVCIRSWAR